MSKPEEIGGDAEAQPQPAVDGVTGADVESPVPAATETPEGEATEPKNDDGGVDAAKTSNDAAATASSPDGGGEQPAQADQQPQPEPGQGAPDQEQQQAAPQTQDDSLLQLPANTGSKQEGQNAEVAAAPSDQQNAEAAAEQNANATEGSHTDASSTAAVVVVDEVSRAAEAAAEAVVDQGDHQQQQQQQQQATHHDSNKQQQQGPRQEDAESLVKAVMDNNAALKNPNVAAMPTEEQSVPTPATPGAIFAAPALHTPTGMAPMKQAAPMTAPMMRNGQYVQQLPAWTPPASVGYRETKKRERRVGKMPPRKLMKVQDGVTIIYESAPGVATNSQNMTADQALNPVMDQDANRNTSMPTQMVVMSSTATAPMPAAHSQLADSVIAAANALVDNAVPRVLSKHDEKWNAMFDKLVAYKNEHGTTLVPQCYDQDSRLGRWVHYQRVEYWIYQQKGSAKITLERIQRLQSIGFEWDPQNAQWNKMYQKLVEFSKEIGHCKVPKGYSKDPELANWVRNQRLEQANRLKGKRSRMTDDRFQKLNTIGFKWSSTINRSPKRATNRAPSGLVQVYGPGNTNVVHTHVPGMPPTAIDAANSFVSPATAAMIGAVKQEVLASRAANAMQMEQQQQMQQQQQQMPPQKQVDPPGAELGASNNASASMPADSIATVHPDEKQDVADAVAAAAAAAAAAVDTSQDPPAAAAAVAVANGAQQDQMVETEDNAPQPTNEAATATATVLPQQSGPENVPTDAVGNTTTV